jgi:hypothetical protein
MSREHYHSPVSRRACDQADFIGQVLSPILVTRSRFAWKSYRMLSHVHIGVSNFERALAFYRSLMDELGFTLKFVELEKPWAGWMQPGPASGQAAMRRRVTDTVRYRRLDRPVSGRPWFLDRDISRCSRFSRGPRALEPSANRQCPSKCGEPSSAVTIPSYSP